MISAQALVEKFRYALENHWGYIWGTAGVLWTQAKQNQKVNYMVSKYGADWKKDADAKKDTYYYASMYGAKWINHYVADCSGLFVWAFKQLGGAIAHGSNSIYNRYCTSDKGKLNDSLKKALVVGTAVFTGDAKSHGHIGLYVGDGKVIEASGTQAGCCISNLSAGKWTYYGMLKDVSYDGSVAPVPVDDNKLPTLRKGSKGEYVTLLQTKLKNKGYDLGKWGVDGDFGSATENAVKEFQKDNGLSPVDGIVGEKTWKALDSSEPMKFYTVTIPHLSFIHADALVKQYGNGASMKLEG